jgi:hypothetical protein
MTLHNKSKKLSPESMLTLKVKHITRKKQEKLHKDRRKNQEQYAMCGCTMVLNTNNKVTNFKLLTLLVYIKK